MASTEYITHKIRGILDFYIEGFKSMTIGRKLWALIILKFIILFCVLKLFFFPDILEQRYDNDEQRSDAVRTILTTQRQ